MRKETGGIDITMRYRGEHPPAHFHAEYAGHKASFDIGTMTMKGSMPPKARGLIVEWAAIHEAELFEDWQRAEAGLPLIEIEGLK
jgi:hypothetical protein